MDASWIWLVVIGVFVLLLLLTIWLLAEIPIVYDENGFRKGVILNRTRYQYGEISACKIGKRYVIIRVGGKNWELEKTKHNEKFLAYAMERYRLEYGMEIPERLVIDENDPFDGKIERVQEYQARIKVSILFLLLGVFAFIGSMFHNINEDNARYCLEGEVAEWYVYEGHENALCFKMEGIEKELKIMSVKNKTIIFDKIRARLQPDDTVKIYCVNRNRGKSNGGYLQVYHMRDAYGTVYVTFEETNAYDNRFDMIKCIAWIIMGVYWICNRRKMNAAIKDPSNYSKRMQKKVKQIEEQFRI